MGHVRVLAHAAPVLAAAHRWTLRPAQKKGGCGLAAFELSSVQGSGMRCTWPVAYRSRWQARVRHGCSTLWFTVMPWHTNRAGKSLHAFGMQAHSVPQVEKGETLSCKIGHRWACAPA